MLIFASLDCFTILTLISASSFVCRTHHFTCLCSTCLVREITVHGNVFFAMQYADVTFVRERFFCGMLHTVRGFDFAMLRWTVAILFDVVYL